MLKFCLWKLKYPPPSVQGMGLALINSSASLSLTSAALPVLHRRRHSQRHSLSSSIKCRPDHPRQSYLRNKATRISCSILEVESNTDDEACELVSGLELSIGEGSDNIQAYLSKAVKNNNGTGVLLLSDIYGFEDSSTRDFAYRVACNGYNVLVPDLFRGDPWGKDRPKAMLEQWIAGQDRGRVMKDIATATNWMVDEFMAAGVVKKLGVIGFCFGGGRVIDALAADESDCFSAGVSFYGTRMDASVASNVKVPVLFITGDADPLSPHGVLSEIQGRIKGSKLLVFKGRGHAFAHRPGSPEEDGDAEQAFLEMRNWLHDGLLVR